MSELDRMEDAFQREIDRYEKELTQLRAENERMRKFIGRVAKSEADYYMADEAEILLAKQEASD